MRALSATLSSLVVIAEKLICQPNTHDLRGYGDLRADVVRAHQRPAESVRTTSAAMVMVIAIDAYRAAPSGAGTPWMMLVASTMPLLRADLFQEFCNEREARS